MSKSKSKNKLNMLFKHKYINLTTYRKNGEGVNTPVMFAEKEGKLYVETLASRYKVARINNNPRVQIAPSNMKGKVLGPSIEGIARVLSKSEQDDAFTALREKYFRLRLGDKIKGKKSEDVDRIYLEISLEI
jgi:PPOX class probable F420-dependent enzyme